MLQKANDIAALDFYARKNFTPRDGRIWVVVVGGIQISAAGRHADDWCRKRRANPEVLKIAGQVGLCLFACICRRRGTRPYGLYRVETVGTTIGMAAKPGTISQLVDFGINVRPRWGRRLAAVSRVAIHIAPRWGEGGNPQHLQFLIDDFGLRILECCWRCCYSHCTPLG